MGLIIGGIGLFIAIITFYYTFFKKPTEELNHLKLQFRANQKLSKELQFELERYMEKENAWNQFMYSNISFKSFLDEMKDSHNKNLSNELYNTLDKGNLTKSNIISMTKSLETQFSALQQIQIEVRMRSRQKI